MRSDWTLPICNGKERLKKLWDTPIDKIDMNLLECIHNDDNFIQCGENDTNPLITSTEELK